ncbi:MAG: response regulator [Vicinamibacteria bacterium]
MKSFLIVDDSSTIRMRMKQAIQNASREAAQFLEAADGETAVTLFEAQKPDAVFLDLVLPEKPDGNLEGHAGLGILRTMLDERPGTPIVLVSAFPQEHSDVVAAISFGAFAHLQKPIKPADVKRVLDALEPIGAAPNSDRFDYR